MILVRYFLLDWWYVSLSDGLFLIEVDRVLKPGGYFVLTSPRSRQQGSKGAISTPFEEFTPKLCWNLLAQQEETFIWQKTTDAQCYISRWDWLLLSDPISFSKPHPCPALILSLFLYPSLPKTFSFIIILQPLSQKLMSMIFVLNCSKHGTFPLCNGEDGQSYYKPLAQCISGTASKRWIPIQNRSSGSLSSAELAIHGM